MEGLSSSFSLPLAALLLMRAGLGYMYFFFSLRTIDMFSPIWNLLFVLPRKFATFNRCLTWKPFSHSSHTLQVGNNVGFV